MSDRIPTEHDMDIVDALDLSYQHWMDGDSDFERDEAITVKRAMNEISRLRAKLERARERLRIIDAGTTDRFAREESQSGLRELDIEGESGL